MPELTAETIETETIDGYAEIVTAFIRARLAVAQSKDAQTAFRAALTAVTDGVAATGGLEYWDDVLDTAYGDRRMPNPPALAVGNQAHAFLELFEQDGGVPPSEDELDQLEETP